MLHSKTMTELHVYYSFILSRNINRESQSLIGFQITFMLLKVLFVFVCSEVWFWNTWLFKLCTAVSHMIHRHTFYLARCGSWMARCWLDLGSMLARCAARYGSWMARCWLDPRNYNCRTLLFPGRFLTTRNNDMNQNTQKPTSTYII